MTGLGWRPLAIGALLVSVAGMVMASPALVVLPWLVAAGSVHATSIAARRQADRQFRTDLPLFVDALIQELKGGGSLSLALRTARGSPVVEQALTPLRATLDTGVGLGTALARFSQHVGPESGGMSLVVNTIEILVLRGGPALASLERLNDTLRSVEAIEAEIRTQASQATASALALAGLPVLFAVGLGAIDRRVAQFYLFDPIGLGCLALSAGLAYGGWTWMGRLIAGGGA